MGDIRSSWLLESSIHRLHSIQVYRINELILFLVGSRGYMKSHSFSVVSFRNHSLVVVRHLDRVVAVLIRDTCGFLVVLPHLTSSMTASASPRAIRLVFCISHSNSFIARFSLPLKNNNAINPSIHPATSPKLLSNSRKKCTP